MVFADFVEFEKDVKAIHSGLYECVRGRFDQGY